jgi:hypothetical protein
MGVVYLNALLRSKQFMLKPLEEFLELDRIRTGNASDAGRECLSEKTSSNVAAAAKESAGSEEVLKESLEDWEKNVLGRQSSEQQQQQQQHSSSTTVPASSSAMQAPPSALKSMGSIKASNNASLMDAANANADQTALRQEKWRKLFTRMKIKLKPRDVGVSARTACSGNGFCNVCVFRLDSLSIV